MNGAYLYIAAGGRARFFATSVWMYEAGVTTTSEDSMVHGGCIYNEVHTYVYMYVSWER